MHANVILIKILLAYRMHILQDSFSTLKKTFFANRDSLASEQKQVLPIHDIYLYSNSPLFIFNKARVYIM